LRLRFPIAVAATVASLVAAAPAAADSNLFFGFADDAIKYEPTAALAVASDLGAKGFRPTLQWHPGEAAVTPAIAGDLARMTSGGARQRIVLSVYGQNYEAPRTDYLRNQYCTFIKDALQRSGIRDVAIWVEPNKQFFWKPQYEGGASVAPRDYVLLLRTCYDLLHAAIPDVNVVAPSTSPKGKDEPFATDNVAHSPGAFIREMGNAYRSLGYTGRIFDTVGHHGYGEHAAERPWKRHDRKRTAVGDYEDLMAALRDAFTGTGQPIPGQGPMIWYLEMGIQTAVPATKVAYYVGEENDAHPVVDDDATRGWNAESSPSAGSPAPDQATQFVDALRLAYCQPYVEAFFNLQVWDEQHLARWQSGVLYFDRSKKASYDAIKHAIAEVNSDAVDCSKLKGSGSSGGGGPTAAPPRAARVAFATASCLGAARTTGVAARITAGAAAVAYTATLQRRVRSAKRPKAFRWQTVAKVTGNVTAGARGAATLRAGNSGKHRIRVKLAGRAPVVSKTFTLRRTC
jgi:hypothetical protein